VEALGLDQGLVARIRAAAFAASGRSDEALAVLEERWDGGGARTDLWALAQLTMRAGRIPEAAAHLEAALAADPGDARAVLLLAEARMAMNDPAGAREALESGIAASPSEGGLHLALARLLGALGDEAGSRAAVASGLAAAPENRQLRVAGAMERERVGDVEGAIAEYEDLYARDAGDLLVANNLASLLAQHRDDEASLARAMTVATRLRDIDEPAFQDTYGWALHRAGRTAEAMPHLTRSADGLAGSAIAQFHLGMAAAAHGDTALARDRLERALSIEADPLPDRSAQAARRALDGLSADAL
jgi:tetratricopeptide (TPR) repeat protein